MAKKVRLRSEAEIRHHVVRWEGLCSSTMLHPLTQVAGRKVTAPELLVIFYEASKRIDALAKKPEHSKEAKRALRKNVRMWMRDLTGEKRVADKAAKLYRQALAA